MNSKSQDDDLYADKPPCRFLFNVLKIEHDEN